MNIHIYYGGRGIIDDPTIYVINKMQEVLEDIHVNVTRYNLYDMKNEIPTLPQTLKEADGIVLATTVEWYGIGGYMQQFLDACFLFGDKEKIRETYMFPVVMATTYGEREAMAQLNTAWEILGGMSSNGICGYIENTVTLEMNQQYTTWIEKSTENLYRTIKYRLTSLPNSNHLVRQQASNKQPMDLTPQETEQLSRYVSDDNYVQRQKEDIQELTNLFRDMMQNETVENEEEYLQEIKKSFHPVAGLEAQYAISIEGKKRKLIISVKGPQMEVKYGACENPTVEMQITRAMMEDIVNGRMTFQRAFMTGAKAKGDFGLLRKLDDIFLFAAK